MVYAFLLIMTWYLYIYILNLVLLVLRLDTNAIYLFINMHMHLVMSSKISTLSPYTIIHVYWYKNICTIMYIVTSHVYTHISFGTTFLASIMYWTMDTRYLSHFPHVDRYLKCYNGGKKSQIRPRDYRYTFRWSFFWIIQPICQFVPKSFTYKYGHKGAF